MAKKRKKITRVCNNCENCTYIGEGDSICILEEPVLILEDWTPTSDFYYCGGSGYEPIGDDEDEEKYSDEW